MEHFSDPRLPIQSGSIAGLEGIRMSIKDQIDKGYSHPAMRRLMYWKYGDDPGCSAEIESTFCAGNQDFANAVCELIDYAADLEDRCLPSNDQR
jgi:hypothetical protein